MPESDPAIDAVLLDAGGVLLLPDPEAFRKQLAPFGLVPDDESCRAAHYAGLAEIDRLGVADFTAANRTIARFLGAADADLEEATRAVQVAFESDPWIPVTGAAEAMRRLQAAGYRLAVVSNAQGTVAEQLEAHRICSVRGGEAAEVAIVVDSHLVGIEKPDPAIFAFALDALGLPPERCIYVGDTVHFDVNGARAAGIRPVHVTWPGLCPHDDHEHVPSLEELAGRLAA
jgi:putative hydrolase of the HAD superfamily